MNPDLSDSSAQLGKKNSLDFQVLQTVSQELGWHHAQPTLAVSEITFCFKSLLLGNWTLGFQKSRVVETGSPSPWPLPPQWQFLGFLSAPIQILRLPLYPLPLWACLLWTSSNFVMSSLPIFQP